MSEVLDSESLHRRIHPSHVKPDGSLSSAAFTAPELSVDRVALRTVAETLANHAGYGVAALSTGYVRSLDQEVRAAPDLLNRAHALVVGRKSKGIQRKIAKSATWVVRTGRFSETSSDETGAESRPPE
jgi:tRNA G18 (ribose-2'-O)-methylase SpoU